MIDEVVVLPVVLPEGEEAREIEELDDVVVQLHGERLLELCLADAEARLLPGLADGGLDAGLRIEAGDEAREVGDLRRAVQLDETAPGGDDLDVVVPHLLRLCLHLEGPVGEIALLAAASDNGASSAARAGRGEGGLEDEEHRLVEDLEKLDLRLADRLPEGEIALADDVGELVLLGEVLELRDGVEDVPVRHGRGGSGEGVGVVHEE